jgi:hypothetical protein
LNFRTKDILYDLLSDVEFTDINIYDDANFPHRDNLPEEIWNSIDDLPAIARGYHTTGKPLTLPSPKTLDRRIGYNWLAIATKAK